MPNWGFFGEVFELFGAFFAKSGSFFTKMESKRGVFDVFEIDTRVIALSLKLTTNVTNCTNFKRGKDSVVQSI